MSKGHCLENKSSSSLTYSRVNAVKEEQNICIKYLTHWKDYTFIVIFIINLI